MADNDPSLYNLRYNQATSNLEGFGGGSPQWTLLTLNNVDPTQVPVTRQINTAAPLMGGGNLAQDLNLSITQATTSTNGYLSSADWNTFNSKQAAGNYITALTGDGTASGPGSAAFTLATVNGNVGTFSLASITVNGKGLITSASSGVAGSLTDVGTDGITITGGTGAVIGSGTSISQHVADTTHNGYLSSSDWNRFNSDTAGITALTGDVSATGPGSATATLATVNSNVGSFTNADITVNAKGLITAASSGPAGITQLTGDVTTGAGGGSQATTLATVNSNVGSFTLASITVNAKGLITAASNGTASVTSVSGTANQITSTGGSTPVLAIANPLTLPGPMTAGGAIAMGANKITGLANGTASTDAAAFGQIKVLQTITGTTQTKTTTSSSSFQATSLAVTITPTSSSNRIMLICQFMVQRGGTGDLAYSIERGSTVLGDSSWGLGFFAQNSGSLSNAQMMQFIAYIDSPSTTSSTTYTLIVRAISSGQNVSAGAGGNNDYASIIAMEVV
jgi:trimeric autotransporter adhesin